MSVHACTMEALENKGTARSVYLLRVLTTASYIPFVKGNKLYMVICFLHFRRQFALLYQLSLCVGRSLQYYKVNGTPEHPHLHALPSLYFSWYSMALLPLEPSGFAPPLPLVQSAFLSLVVAAPQLC